MGGGNTSSSAILSAEYWMYDTRLGRRWNLDPVGHADFSPYLTFANNPIYYSDPLGLDSANGSSGGSSGPSANVAPPQNMDDQLEYEGRSYGPVPGTGGLEWDLVREGAVVEVTAKRPNIVEKVLDGMVDGALDAAAGYTILGLDIMNPFAYDAQRRWGERLVGLARLGYIAMMSPAERYREVFLPMGMEAMTYDAYDWSRVGTKFLINAGVGYGVGRLMSSSPALGEATSETVATETMVATEVGLSEIKIYCSLTEKFGEGYKSVSVARGNYVDVVYGRNLNAASKGVWYKVLEAGYLNGSKVEVHYFYNTTTGQYANPFIKMGSWGSKPFKN